MLKEYIGDARKNFKKFIRKINCKILNCNKISKRRRRHFANLLKNKGRTTALFIVTGDRGAAHPTLATLNDFFHSFYSSSIHIYSKCMAGPRSPCKPNDI